MTSPKFALVEEGTSRVMLWTESGSSVMRTLDGTWVSAPRTPDDVVMPDELGDFRAASSMELSALAQEAAASSLDIPILSKAD